MLPIYVKRARVDGNAPTFRVSPNLYMRKNVLYGLFIIGVPCLHEQHPGCACTAGWSSLTELDGDPPAAAFSSRQSVKRVLISLYRGICQVFDCGGEERDARTLSM
jgi:hypothetical protein